MAQESSEQHGESAKSVTRLAPSPTGALHLGNARTFLINWALARRLGWSIVLRIEDLDGPRIKPGAIEGTIDLLQWLGMNWDVGPIIQSSDLAPYRRAMERLARAGLVYPCALTRKEIADAASAPHEGESGGEVRFPPELRPAERPNEFVDARTNWRFVTPERTVEFDDGFRGQTIARPFVSIGDFVLWTNREQPAYQLAVVVDDHRQGVTEIVRGDDLLDSAGRQMLLYEALGYTPTPRSTHLPLVVGADGRRLAKRHGDTRLTTYREQGVSAERVIGLLAEWSGLGARRPMDAVEFSERFDLRTMGAEKVVFRSEDDAWLLGSK